MFRFHTLCTLLMWCPPDNQNIFLVSVTATVLFAGLNQLGNWPHYFIALTHSCFGNVLRICLPEYICTYPLSSSRELHPWGCPLSAGLLRPAHLVVFLFTSTWALCISTLSVISIFISLLHNHLFRRALNKYCGKIMLRKDFKRFQ